MLSLAEPSGFGDGGGGHNQVSGGVDSFGVALEVLLRMVFVIVVEMLFLTETLSVMDI